MRVSVIGVALIASLSGFGAVSAPVQNLEVLKRPVTERDVQVIENKIQQTLGMVFRKKKVLLESQSAQGGKVYTTAFLNMEARLSHKTRS